MIFRPTKTTSYGNKFINFQFQMDSSVVRGTCFAERHFPILRHAADNKLINCGPTFDSYLNENAIKLNENNTIFVMEGNDLFAHNSDCVILSVSILV